MGKIFKQSSALRLSSPSLLGRTRLVGSLLLVGLFSNACQPTKPSANSEGQSVESALDTTAELMDSIKCIVPSPQWYKDLWLDINSKENLLGRALMTHYMACSGQTYRLSEAEFRSLPVAMVPQELGPIYLSREFINDAIKNLIGRVGDTIADIDDSLIASTHYGNTLGHFQMELRGKLVWRNSDSGVIVPHFAGKVRVKDRYDFNPSETPLKDSWRGNDTELRVRIAHVGMPGRAFDIESDWMEFSFDYPQYESDLIQDSPNSVKSGYSSYGEQIQLILMTELRSSRWEKASLTERFTILLRTMKRIHDAVRERSSV